MNGLRYLLVATTAAVAFAGATPAAHAVIIGHSYTFDFAGVCSDCDGTADAQLAVKNYTLGNDFSTANFVSFTYDGTNLLPEFEMTSATDFSGAIGPGLPGAFTVTIIGMSTGGESIAFSSTASGVWSVTAHSVNADQGTSSSWSAVPEPFSMTLLGTGLVGLGVARRRRHAVAADHPPGGDCLT